MYAIRCRRNRRYPFEVRWHAAGRACPSQPAERATLVLVADWVPGGEEFLHEGRQVSGFGDQVKVAAVVYAEPASRDQAVQDPRVYLRDDGVIVAGEYQGGLTHQRR